MALSKKIYRVILRFINFLAKFDEIKRNPNCVDWEQIKLDKDRFFKTIRLNKIPKPKRSKLWTDLEIETLLKGVELFGEGAWMQIKRHCSLLSHRTANSIKDKWRSMNKQKLKSHSHT